MIRTPVVSSNIRSVGYAPGEKKLEIEFHDGSIHHYHDVSSEEHHSLMTAPSVGKHFHAHIKHKHPHSKA